MKRILIPVGCRSDEGLSAPVIKRLRECFDVVILQLIPQQFGASYHLTEAMLYETHSDLIIITGDRVEMCAAAAAAFHNKVPIAHFYAGTTNDPITTFDDVDRHCITLWSDIQFCESDDTAHTTWKLMTRAGLKPNVFIVGISHLDDLEIDESKVPGEPYDLLLLNAEPFTYGNWNSPNKERFTIQVCGNPDGSTPLVGDVLWGNTPRPQFHGLLKNCTRFITNSSAAIYEAPHWLKPEQIIMVGDRNRNRTPCPLQPGASDRIVNILKEYFHVE